MIEKTIEVPDRVQIPDGMLDAATRVIPTNLTRAEYTMILEAAALWLIRRPFYPTEEWILERLRKADLHLSLSANLSTMLAEWQRVMFRVPDQDFPEIVKR